LQSLRGVFCCFETEDVQNLGCAKLTKAENELKIRNKLKYPLPPISFALGLCRKQHFLKLVLRLQEKVGIQAGHHGTEQTQAEAVRLLKVEQRVDLLRAIHNHQAIQQSLSNSSQYSKHFCSVQLTGY
jgi:hypothetical protein